MPKYQVRFATKLEGVNAVAWKPNEMDEYDVRKSVALTRAEVLFRDAVKGVAVEGLLPYLIEIFDTDGSMMLSVTTESEDEPCGPWANLFVGETEMA